MQMRSLRQTPRHLALQSLTRWFEGKKFFFAKQISLIRIKGNSPGDQFFPAKFLWKKTGIFLDSKGTVRWLTGRRNSHQHFFREVSRSSWHFTCWWLWLTRWHLTCAESASFYETFQSRFVLEFLFKVFQGEYFFSL